MSAGAYAMFDQPARRVGVKAPASVAEVRAAIVAGKFAQEAVGVWAAMDVTVRMMVIMAACGQPDQVERLVHQPWDSFSAVDQLAMVSAARLIRSSLQQFAAVA